ncbi:hypothetical protein H334_16575 [Vibrio parahaemolyticus 901128]|nr:hypothetical protein H334_16575 [Vibrio parahaemolyticus 901128]
MSHIHQNHVFINNKALLTLMLSAGLFFMFDESQIYKTNTLAFKTRA